MHANSHEICMLINELLFDHVKELSLEICGAASGNGVRAVGVNYKAASNSDSLDTKIFEMRNSFVYDGIHLNIVTVVRPDAFVIPGPAKEDVNGPADFDAAMTDIRAPLGPPPQVRSPARDFPVRRLFLQPSAPVPALPGSSSDTPAWASSLVAQISDIHQNMVTRTFLEQYQQGQTEELKTYIDAEVSSVRNWVDDLEKMQSSRSTALTN